tara:strand:+ start:84 stop:347 length:264 start_codon:yes stop_codon:yes gene_type:complete
MEKTYSVSESLVGSLCKEIEFIRKKTRFIRDSLINCNDKSLKIRLLQELETHKNRRNELFSISSLLKSQKSSDNLSSLFLMELYRRL